MKKRIQEKVQTLNLWATSGDFNHNIGVFALKIMQEKNSSSISHYASTVNRI